MQSSATTKPAWGGWGQVSHHSATPLENVMSEELVEQIKLEESDGSFFDDKRHDENTRSLVEQDQTKDDLLLAQKLQMEFDAEYATQQQQQQSNTRQSEEGELNEQKVIVNEGDKIKENPKKYDGYPEDEDEDDDDIDEPQKDRTPQFNNRGMCGKGKNIVTKHDAVICSRKNAKRVMERFPAGIETGDDYSFDMRLSNSVYNQLKSHSNVDNKRSQRLHEKKEHSTVEQTMDANTRLILYKLVNSGVLNAVNGVIATGKESTVLYGLGGSLPNEMVPKECAVKVFKTTLAEFKNRCQYVRGDVRFFKDEFKKQNPRRIMKIWAEKEAINLKRMARFGIPCPAVVLLKKHVLVMSFLGEDRVAAPKLKDAVLSDAELQLAFEQCVQHMKTMYKSCLLVHADLSEYNILWHDDKVFFIDVAQAVDTQHPNALQFLLRDCQNVSDFFSRRNVASVPHAHDLFNDITGLSLHGESLQEFLAPVEKYEKDERHLQLGNTRMEYPFNYFFERSCVRERGRRIDDGEEGKDETDPFNYFVERSSVKDTGLGNAEGRSDTDSSEEEEEVAGEREEGKLDNCLGKVEN